MKQGPLYEKIYQDISQAIISGKWKVGDCLPAEKELSDTYHVSRITTKKALELLAGEGKIVRIAGRGSFVQDVEELQPEKNQDEMASETGVRTAANAAACVNKGGQSGMIGVILEDFGSDFGTVLLNSIELSCREQGYHMMLSCSRGSVEAEAKAIDEFRSLGVQGILMMCVQDETYNARVLQMVVENYPVVTVDRQLKGLPVPYVGTDHRAAARELTEYLLEKGCRSICFVKPAADETSSLLERRGGFVSALNEHGVAADEGDWISDLKCTLPSTYLDKGKNNPRMVMEQAVRQDQERIGRYLDEHPHTDAFFAAEYRIASMIDECLRKKGRSNSCLVVCFDGGDDMCRPGMFTHIRQDEAAIGSAAVQALADVIHGISVQGQILVPYELRKVEDV